MKKVILVLTILAGAAGLKAQNINPEFDYSPGPEKKSHYTESHTYVGRRSDWCLEVIATGGFAMQKISGNDAAAGYLNAVNKNISNVKYRNGFSRGIDAELVYFFGANREFGIGSGILYVRLHGN